MEENLFIIPSEIILISCSDSHTFSLRKKTREFKINASSQEFSLVYTEHILMYTKTIEGVEK